MSSVYCEYSVVLYLVIPKGACMSSVYCEYSAVLYLVIPVGSRVAG
jgi:hypothetical protein